MAQNDRNHRNNRLCELMFRVIDEEIPANDMWEMTVERLHGQDADLDKAMTRAAGAHDLTLDLLIALSEKLCPVQNEAAGEGVA